jgi:predicted TPR repeat methyltransferase
VQGQVNTQATDAYTAMSTAYTNAVSVYRQIASLNPIDPSVQLQLAEAADASGDTKTSTAAYRRFLKLAPDDPTAPAIRQRLKQLQATPKPRTTVKAGR